MLLIRPALLLAAVLLLGTGCSGRSAPPSIYLGHVTVQSGPERDVGEAEIRGIRLAVEEVNKDPEALGRVVKVLHADTRGKPEVFEAAAVRLVTVNRVAGLLGGNTAEQTERMGLAKAPLVSFCGRRTLKMGDGVFCTGLSPAYQGKLLARAAVEQLRQVAVAVVEDERRDEFRDAAGAFRTELPRTANKANLGPAHISSWRYGKDVKFADLARHIKERDYPKLLFFAGTPADLRLLRSELPDVPVLFGGDEGAANELRGYRETASGLYLITAFTPDADLPHVKAFVKKYREANSEDPDIHAALAYDGLRLLYEAMQQAKDALTETSIREKLAGLKDFDGLTGRLSFGEGPRLRRPAFLVQLEKGQVKHVKRYGAEE
jgi:branched-chain amino acid transport system substrate-binding protein